MGRAGVHGKRIVIRIDVSMEVNYPYINTNRCNNIKKVKLKKVNSYVFESNKIFNVNEVTDTILFTFGQPPSHKFNVYLHIHI